MWRYHSEKLTVNNQTLWEEAVHQKQHMIRMWGCMLEPNEELAEVEPEVRSLRTMRFINLTHKALRRQRS